LHLTGERKGGERSDKTVSIFKRNGGKGPTIGTMSNNSEILISCKLLAKEVEIYPKRKRTLLLQKCKHGRRERTYCFPERLRLRIRKGGGGGSQKLHVELT